jgi:hypothetical protein
MTCPRACTAGRPGRAPAGWGTGARPVARPARAGTGRRPSCSATRCVRAQRVHRACAIGTARVIVKHLQQGVGHWLMGGRVGWWAVPPAGRLPTHSRPTTPAHPAWVQVLSVRAGGRLGRRRGRGGAHPLPAADAPAVLARAEVSRRGPANGALSVLRSMFGVLGGSCSQGPRSQLHLDRGSPAIGEPLRPLPDARPLLLAS